MAVTNPLGDFANVFNKAGLPLVLIVGGLAVSFAGSFVGKWEFLLRALGFMGVGAGLTMYVQNSSALAARATFPTSMDIETNMYANPVNNLSNVPKRNRFDLQTNYIIGNPNTNEEYMNDLILNEVKSMSIGSNNYPVRMNPWELKTMIPTTQVEPSRDFNTVKMVMA